MTSCFWQGLLTALGSRGSTRTHRDVKEKAAFSWFSLLSVLFIDRLSFLFLSLWILAIVCYWGCSPLFSFCHFFTISSSVISGVVCEFIFRPRPCWCRALHSLSWIYIHIMLELTCGKTDSCVGTTVSDEKLKAEQRDIQNNQKCWTDDVCWNNIDSGDFPGCGCTDETALKTPTYIICPPRKYKEIVMTSLKTEIHWRTCKIYKCCSPVYEH